MYDVKIIDALHLMNRTFHVADTRDYMDPMRQARFLELKALDSITDDEFEEIKELAVEYAKIKVGLTMHVTIQSVLSIMKKFPSKHTVLAWDKNSWRYGEYDGYKANRKEARDEQTPDEKLVWHMLYSSMNDLRDVLAGSNVTSMMIDGAEADDVVGVLSKYLDTKVLVVSSDKDMHQVLQYPNVKIWDPIKEQMIKQSVEEAQWGLFLKCVRGDKGDGISSAKPRVRETKVRTWYDDDSEFDRFKKEEEDKMMAEVEKIESDSSLTEDEKKIKIDAVPDFTKLFERNERLISFRHIPTDIHLRVIEAYESHLEDEPGSYDMTSWLKFCRKYSLNDIVGRLDSVKEFLYER